MDYTSDLLKYQVYKEDPQGFFEDILQIKLLPWQEEVCQEIKQQFLATKQVNQAFKMAIAGGNNTGKSTFGRLLMIWHFASHVNSRNYMLTNSENQTKRTGFGKVQNELVRLFDSKKIMIGDSIYFKDKEGTSRDQWDIGFLAITLKQSSITGLHDPNMFFFFDEAVNFNDEIWNGLDTMIASGRVLVYCAANPTSTKGRFYEIFYNKKHGIDDSWYTKSVGISDLPPHMFDEQWVKNYIAVHGPNSPETRAAIYGEFADDVGGSNRFAIHEIIAAMNRPVHNHSIGPIIMGIDAAENADHGASNAICVRQGSNILFWQSFPCLCEEFKIILQRTVNQYNPAIIAVDANGVGTYLYYELYSVYLGHRRVVRVKGHSCAFNEEMFADKRTELFWELGNMLLSGSACMPYDPDVLLVLRHMSFDTNEKGKIVITSKKDLKKMVGRSYGAAFDKIDALAHTFAEFESTKGININNFQGVSHYV